MDGGAGQGAERTRPLPVTATLGFPGFYRSRLVKMTIAEKNATTATAASSEIVRVEAGAHDVLGRVVSEEGKRPKAGHRWPEPSHVLKDKGCGDEAGRPPHRGAAFTQRRADDETQHAPGGKQQSGDCSDAQDLRRRHAQITH